MTLLIIYSALSTLAALYCGWCAVKRLNERNSVTLEAMQKIDAVTYDLTKERDEWKSKHNFLLKSHNVLASECAGYCDEFEAELTHATEWLNAANDRVRELEESIVEEAKQTILKMRPDVEQVLFLIPRGQMKPRPYVDEFEECNEWEEQS